MAKATKGALKPKHIPQRTCVACRSTESKRALVRVVRTVEGTIEIDPTGKKAGRGAYVHKSSQCWDLALKRKQLENNLKVTLTPENRAVLNEYAATLLPDETAIPVTEPPK